MNVPKGGAEAALNAVAINADAIVFNPMTAFFNQYDLDDSTYEGTLSIYIVKGEILNNIFGPITRKTGEVTYLPQQHFNRVSFLLGPKANAAVNTYMAIQNHYMEAVKKAIDEWEANGGK